MQETISLFTKKYGLIRSDVIVEIEKVFSEVFTRRYGCEVMAAFQKDMQLEVVAYNEAGGIVQQRVVELNNIRGWNTIRKHLEKSLLKASVLKQTRQYKYYERELRWGEITAIDLEKNYHVELEVIPGETVTAVCPLNRVGLHERSSGDLSIGEKRAFHVRRVDPVFLHGTPRLKVVVDRISKTLVETLLKEQLGYSVEKMTIRCTKGYVGQKSFVVTSRRIPKPAIMAVTRELKERLQVRIDRNLCAIKGGYR
ncbi:MAG: hypothetical protein BA866_06665 [Desulfobulbaceae bacterium S5133MH15]|nr:MAG: hypothetical protein BA866_06665 [Desulfobulbaceae bacterium S5133MH15]